MVWPQSRRKRICRQKEKMWNNKALFQVHQSCACPGCPDHIKYGKDKAVQILPTIDLNEGVQCSDYIALARKLICLIYHLLINQELYQEDECRKRRSSHDKSCQAPSFQEEHLTDRVAAIVDAFYHMNERSRKNALMREITDISGIKVGQKRPSNGGG